jgi:group I intron endonuclease
MKSGIYKITNPKGKIYIGCTNNLEKRIKNYQNGKITTQPLMFESWSKYGWDSHTFEILEYTENLIEREKYYIKLYDSFNNGLNANKGGGGIETHTEETKQLISEKGRANKGKRANSHRKGKKLPPYMVEANRANKGKRANSHREGKKISESHRQNLMGRRGAYDKGKAVLQFDIEGNLIQEHPTLKSASKAVGVGIGAIWNALNKGGGATSASYIWKYKE